VYFVVCRPLATVIIWAVVLQVSGLVEEAKEKGATCLMGGAPHPAGELYYQPTILTGVQANMTLFQVGQTNMF
jgi:hypothetical protein